MASRKKKQEQANRNWITGIIVSVLLLALFLFLQQNDSKMLNLEIKWLIVASVPLILAILRSNVIQKFKGFGIELETRLQESVGNINLVAMNALADLPSDEKQSIMYLQNLPESRRIQIQRLTFREGRQGYYQLEAMRAYIQGLPNLKFFEVLSSEGKFIALIPVELFRLREYIDMERLESFIRYVAEKETIKFSPQSIITEFVPESENLVKVLPVIRKSKYGILPVISDSGNLLGVITIGLIESKIADEVLATQESE